MPAREELLILISPTVRYVRYSIIAGCKVPVNYAANATTPTGATAASITNWFVTSPGNAILNTVDDAKLVNPFNSENFDPPFFNFTFSNGGNLPILNG